MVVETAPQTEQERHQSDATALLHTETFAIVAGDIDGIIRWCSREHKPFFVGVGSWKPDPKAEAIVEPCVLFGGFGANEVVSFGYLGNQTSVIYGMKELFSNPNDGLGTVAHKFKKIVFGDEAKKQAGWTQLSNGLIFSFVA